MTAGFTALARGRGFSSRRASFQVARTSASDANVLATVTSSVSTASSARFSDALSRMRVCVSPSRRAVLSASTASNASISFLTPSMGMSCVANCVACGVAAARNPRPNVTSCRSPIRTGASAWFASSGMVLDSTHAVLAARTRTSTSCWRAPAFRAARADRDDTCSATSNASIAATSVATIDIAPCAQLLSANR